MQSCRMRVPIVIWPWGEAVAFASVRHLITIEVDDIDTCSKQPLKHLSEDLR